jgi:hypothetical protein
MAVCAFLIYLCRFYVGANSEVMESTVNQVLPRRGELTDYNVLNLGVISELFSPWLCSGICKNFLKIMKQRW